MPFFQIMWPNLRNSKNKFLMMSHFGTLLQHVLEDANYALK